MRRAVRLYVSASADLEAERDLIGRLVAGMPVTLGWQIGRAPLPGHERDEVTVHVAPHDCDLYIFMLGRDITAPAGIEWDAAHEVQHSILALLKNVPRTPAGLVFQRLGIGEWTVYSTQAEFERIVRAWLVRQLLDGQDRFGLVLSEVEALIALASRLAREIESAPAPAGDAERSAGGAGVILATHSTD
ncbi:MAG: hypothetical protein KDH90_06010 [Anaerolineae bacterium]|nr:hypothetical protein [Anaerolineae bacterium]HRX02567.1 hypothetical protein [Anaerolineae bacterium]